MPFSVREGINIFLAGFVPTENLRFRDEELNFKLATSTGLSELSFFYSQRKDAKNSSSLTFLILSH